MKEINKEKVNIEILPDEAKKELLNFYNELLKKYNINKKGSLPESFYNPIKVESYSKIAKREEIYDRR